MVTLSLPARAATLAAVALLVACKDSNAPPDPNRIASVFVGTQVDSATLRDQGEFVLSLVPVNGRGEVVFENITITPAVTGAGPAAALDGAPQIVPADPRPVAAAINLDNSLSMRTSDPQRQRVAAAKQFWTALLGADPRNEIALLSFGVSTPSEGFSATRLLQDWTTNPELLASVLDTMGTGPGSPLYRSSRETVGWMDSTRSAGDRRILVLFTDALPDDPTLEPSLLELAQSSGVTIHAVGLGPASDQSPASRDSAVARLARLADATGGVYAGAPTAGALPLLFSALASVSSRGALLATVQLSPVPPPGTVVNGTVSVANFAGAATGRWTVTVK